MVLSHFFNDKSETAQSQAADFFKAIFSRLAGGFLEIRALSEPVQPRQYFFSIPSELSKAAALAVSLNNQAYYSAAPRSKRKGTADAVEIIPAFWTDGDEGALPWTSLALTPAVVVNTGNIAGDHYQAHYLLDSPLQFKTESDRGKAVAYLKALCTVLRGDPSSCDIARVLRVPGTYNTKDPSHPGLCRIVEFNLDARYSIEQIREAITISLILRHWDKEQRQALDLSLAGYLAKSGVAQGEAKALLLSLLNMTGTEEPKRRAHELLTNYKDVAKRQKIKGYTELKEYLRKDELTALDSLWGDFREQRGKTKPRGAEGAKEGPERSDELNTLAVEKLLENCAFVQRCRDEAVTLSEPCWWSMVTILAVFGEPGREKIHELSKPYPKYTEKETEQKIKEALKSGEKEIGPHTCLFIQDDLRFDCSEDCRAKTMRAKSPAGMAVKVIRRETPLGDATLPTIVCSGQHRRSFPRYPQ